MKKFVKEMRKKWADEEKKYSFENYKPTKNCKPCTVNGITYLSKKQACVLEGITRSELDAYLKREELKTPVEKTKEDVVKEEN